MAKSRFLEDENDPLFDERKEEVPEDKEDYDEEGFLEEEETLGELDVDDRGHVRPRRRQDDEEIDPEY